MSNLQVTIMGYTNYHVVKGDAPTPTQWDLFCAEAATILKPHEDDLDELAINDEHIWFNGIGEESHETFVLRRLDNGFNFCKTARKPYDAAVVAILRLAKKHFPDWLDLSSDGDGKSDWITASNPEGWVFPD